MTTHGSRTVASAAFVAVALAGALPARVTAAPAAGAGPQGRKCRFVSVQDVGSTAQAQVGQADAGPLVSDAPGTVTCQIFVNGVAVPTGAVSAHSVGVGPARVTVVAGTLTYRANVGDVVGLCTIWQPDAGPALWWRGSGDLLFDPAGGTWMSSPPDGCLVPLPPGDANARFCPLWLTADKYAGTDVAGIWQDCEPYEPIL